MPKHRGHNEGSATQRENGKWRARVFVNGRRLSHEAPTKDEANRWIRKQLSDAEQGLLPVDGGKVTVASFLDTWIKIVATTVKPKTLQTYEGAVRLHLAPRLGKIKLAQLKPDHLQSLYAEQLSTGYSAKTVQVDHAVIHRALTDALKWGKVARNVADAVSVPKATRKEIKAWTPEEAREFLNGVAGDRKEALYRLALSTGLRMGELLGLRWEDLDLQTGHLQVRRTVQRLGKGGGIHVGEPKSNKGRRQIVLPAQAVEAIRQWRVRQMEERLIAGPRWRDTGYLFTSSVGTPMERTALREHFKRAVEALRLPMIRFHDLRHTCATVLLSQGVHPKVVQEMLGHSTIAMTMDTYSHILPSMQEDAARVMDMVLTT